LCSTYKIYAEILRNRLEKEVIRKGLLPESQVGFRKKRSTMDIYVLNHIIQRKRERERRRKKKKKRKVMYCL